MYRMVVDGSRMDGSYIHSENDYPTLADALGRIGRNFGKIYDTEASATKLSVRVLGPDNRVYAKINYSLNVELFAEGV